VEETTVEQRGGRNAKILSVFALICVALYFMHYKHYNFCRIHQTLRVTPAMEAGISDHVWTMTEIVTLSP